MCGGGVRKVKENFVKFRIVRVGQGRRGGGGQGLHISDKLSCAAFLFHLFFYFVQFGDGH